MKDEEFLQQRSRLGLSGKALGWYAEQPRFDSVLVLLSLQNFRSVDTVYSDVGPDH